MWIVCQADDLHEISRLVFFEKIKKNKNKCRLLQIVHGALRVKLYPFEDNLNSLFSRLFFFLYFVWKK